MCQLTRVSVLLPTLRSVCWGNCLLFWRRSVLSGRQAPTLPSNSDSSLGLYLRLPRGVTSGSNASARCNNQIVSSRVRNMVNFNCLACVVRSRKSTTGLSHTFNHLYSWLHEHVTVIWPTHCNNCPIIQLIICNLCSWYSTEHYFSSYIYGADIHVNIPHRTSWLGGPRSLPAHILPSPPVSNKTLPFDANYNLLSSGSLNNKCVAWNRADELMQLTCE